MSAHGLKSFKDLKSLRRMEGMNEMHEMEGMNEMNEMETGMMRGITKRLQEQQEMQSVQEQAQEQAQQNEYRGACVVYNYNGQYYKFVYPTVTKEVLDTIHKKIFWALNVGIKISIKPLAIIMRDTENS